MPYGYGASADFSPSGSSGPAGGASTGGNYGGDSSGGVSQNQMSNTSSNTGGDRIQRIAAGIEPGYRPQDPQPFGKSPEEAYFAGQITKDQYEETIAKTQEIPDQRSLLEKTIDLYQQYSPLGMVTNLLEGLLGPTVPSTGNVGPAGIKTDGTYGTVEDAIRAGERNEPMVDSGGESERDMINRLIPYAPYAITDTTPQDSMVNQYFANLGMNNQPLSSNLQTDYNNAKTNINSLLGILPPSQQFGYSEQPYGLLSSTNLEDNPFYIDYLQERGLI